jgi:ATP/maltotriose-dependent transcriptional regulator MalT
MTRTLNTMMAVCLGTILLTSAACENKETEAALKTCKSDLGNEQKRANDQQTTINALKAQLATAQTKLDEMTKAAAKPDEKAKAGEAKKDEPAKMAPSANKKGKKK